MDESWSERIKNFLTITLGIGIVLLGWYALSKAAGRLYYLFWDAVYVLIIPAWAILRYLHIHSVGYVPSADPALWILHPDSAFDAMFATPLAAVVIGWLFGSWVEGKRRALDMVMVVLPIVLLPIYMYIWGVAKTYPGGAIMYKLEQFTESCPSQRSAISQCTYTPLPNGRFL